MKVLLAVLAGVSAILLYLLTLASADTTLFARHMPLLIGTAAGIVLMQLGVVTVQLRSFWIEYRRAEFGSRLKLRLLQMLALVAVVPGVLVYAVSMQFAVKSIDSWFDVRIESALEGGLDLGRGVLEAMQDEILTKGRSMAYDLAAVPVTSPVLLNRLREQAGVQSASLLTVSGQLVANSGGGLEGLLPVLPPASQLRQARLGTGSARIDGDTGSGFVVRALVPVNRYRLDSEPLVLQLEHAVPEAITRSAALVENAQRDYQELQLGRAGLKRIYTLGLTFTLLLGLFLAIALAIIRAERLTQPLQMLSDGTRAVAAGDLTPRKVIETDDELGVLTRSFNEMTVQLNQARIEREAAQRAAVWGEVARRLAHEIKNPLTPIQLSAERLQMKLADKLDGEAAAMLNRATRTIVEQVEAMKNMVNDFREYARLPPPAVRPLDLNMLITEVLDLYTGGPAGVNAALEPTLPKVLADADQVRQVLHNLIKNAAEAMHEQAAAVVTVSTRLNRDMAVLSVTDSGPGFPPEIFAHAFEPYVTTKPKGTGLGLAIVRKIVDDHGGTISLANRSDGQGGGAEVSVQLPLHRNSQGDATAA